MADDDLKVADMSGLTDADWSNINRLRQLYKDEGVKGLNGGLAKLRERDVIQYSRVIGAFFPNEFRDAIRDEMASLGMDEDDLRQLIRKLESPARDQ